MAKQLMKTVNFGRGKAGLSTVGYALYDASGTENGTRTTAGVFELGSNTGIYGARITFSKNFVGTILWDTGESTPIFASDEYNGVEEDVSFIKSVTGGRWKLNPITNVMTFYEEDNLTPVASFSMYNSTNQPSVLEVHQRLRNDDNVDAKQLVAGIDS
jgi:hypothetical protein